MGPQNSIEGDSPAPATTKPIVTDAELSEHEAARMRDGGGVGRDGHVGDVLLNEYEERPVEEAGYGHGV